MTKIKIVLDTNVYLSGIIFGGNTKHLLDLIIDRQLIAFTSPAILLEIAQKLKDKFHWRKDQILLAIKTIGKTTNIIRPRQKLNLVKSDKSDNKIIEAAKEAEVNYIITGDHHLLKIKKYQKIKILSPAEFLQTYFQ